MVRDESEDALAGFLYAPLGPTDELHVIILQPFWIPLAERLPVALIVVAHEAADPFALVCAVAGIGRVAEDHEDGLMLFDFVGGVGLIRKHPQWAELLGGFLQVF